MDKKKALILYGSPHKNGHTKKALDAIIFKLRDKYEFNLINAYKENIKPCIDCRFCCSSGQCSFSDFNDIDKKLREAELLIIASPVYNYSFPAPLKAILDRTQLYFNMKTKLKINPFLKQKKAILIATYGSEDDSCEEIILKQLRLFFILLNAKLSKAIFISNTDK